MTVITIDRSTVEKLRNLDGPAQLRDERGVVLGEFRPSIHRDARPESPLTEEEIRRREREAEVFTTAEVLRQLGAT